MRPVAPALADVIDALDQGLPISRAREEWLEQAERLRRKMERVFDYFRGEGERALCAEVEDLLEKTEQALQAEPPDLDLLLDLGMRLQTAETALFETRGELLLMPLRPLDELACAVVALGRGGASREAVLSRIPPAERAFNRARALFEPTAAGFPPDVAQAVRRGFQDIEQALAHLADYRLEPSPRNLREAEEALARGGPLLGLFTQSLRKGAAEAGFCIPLLGPILEALELELDDYTVRLLREKGLPQLQGFVERHRDRWLLPAHLSESLQEQLERRLDRFERALEKVEKNPDGFWDAVDELDEAFVEVRDRSLPVESLLNSSYGPEAALVLGLLEGEATLYQAASAAEAMREGDVPPVLLELAGRLEQFYETESPTVLLEALELLLAEVTNG